MSTPVEEKLSWKEIKREFPDQWVALAEVDRELTEFELRSAVVIGHSKNRDEVIVASKAAANRGVGAILFTGEVGLGSFLF